MPDASGRVPLPDRTPCLYFRFPVAFVVGMSTVLMLANVGLVGSLVVTGGRPFAWRLAVGVACVAALWSRRVSSTEYDVVVARAQLNWRLVRRGWRFPIANIVKVRPSATRSGSGLMAVAAVVALAGCGTTAAHTARARLSGPSQPRTPSPVAELARGAQGSRASIPWAEVGPGWILAEWTATPPGPPGAAPSSSPVDVFLVDPVGGATWWPRCRPTRLACRPGLETGTGHCSTEAGSALRGRWPCRS